MKEMLKFSITTFVCLLLVTACGEPDTGEKAFEPIYTGYQEILAYSGSNYDEPIKKIDSLQNQIRTYLNRFPKSEKRTEAERILSETKNMQLELQREQFEFLELEKQFKLNPTPYQADTEINEIKSFIRKYPRSFKRNHLTDRLDELNFKKFQTETALAINTIPDLNRVVQISRDYLVQIQKKSLKDQVKDKINKTEAQRPTVYRNEFLLKVDELRKRMKWEAIEIAKKSHPFSNIQGVKGNVISGDVSTAAAGSITVVREYTIHMVGALIGHNRYRVTIQAKGIIGGTLLNGVSYSVTKTVKVSDFRVN